ncbi:MAG: hypothetical protein J2P21_28780 [Chloracidobacterium sp.]|nr:hypothetical protein [Chloracidobacterium sp.]
MKLIEKKLFAIAHRATLSVMVALFALALSSSQAAAFPINCGGNKNSQNRNYDAAAARPFVGVWRVKEHPRDIFYRVITIKMEGERLTAAVRFSLIYYEPGTNVGRIAEERDHPLSDLKIEGSTLTARLIGTKQAEGDTQNLETLYRMTLINSDEIKVECAGEPSPYDNLTLKREK